MEKKAEAGSDIADAVEAGETNRPNRSYFFPQCNWWCSSSQPVVPPVSTEVAVISQSLSPFPSPQDKLDHLLRRHAELVRTRGAPCRHPSKPDTQ